MSESFGKLLTRSIDWDGAEKLLGKGFVGAESPEEIALAIAAELVCIRRSGAAAARALRRTDD